MGDPQRAGVLAAGGCVWRLLPHDLPPWQTVYHYWRRWQQEGVWERMLTALRERERARLGRLSASVARVGGPGLPRSRLPCLGPGSHWHHRGDRAAPRRRTPLDLGSGGGSTASRAAPA
ncbi:MULTISPECIES: transposase [unclassified Streptomyces]|uniref:transposase n=1 Tax=unclassified Streptomyces TaxID=2593676 RepID=UPI00386B41F0